jgi:hypothetical protein
LREQTAAFALGERDRSLARSVLEGARQAFGRWLETHLAADAHARTQVVHSALGRLAVRADGPDTFPGAGLRHGCTPAVREQAAFFVAQGTAREAHEGMALFRASVPSESTIKRVAAGEGKALGTLWREQTSALIAPALNALETDVDLVSVSADGAMVPMRTEEEAGLRPWREARLVTVTLDAKPDPARQGAGSAARASGHPRGRGRLVRRGLPHKRV